MLSQNFTRLLIPRFTQFNLLTDNKKSFTQIQEELSTNEIRNLLILEDIVHTLQQGRTPLILTSRTSHVKLLAELLQPHCKHVITLLGSESNKVKRQHTEKLKSIPTTESLAIIATGKYIGEGFDYPRLDTLFLTMPVSWKGLVAQYAGRLHRDYEGKVDVRIYDYVDIRVPLCELMYRQRLKGYSAVGY
jgi:superfamily II DNA or RNA helicase